jgi:hypothetical protein
MSTRSLSLAAVVTALLFASCGDRPGTTGPEGAEAPAAPVAAEDLAIWKDFVSAMKAGGPAPERINPYYEDLRQPILGFFKEMR